ncbi:MAG TPA: MMPL family transporter [Kofleriaceae bacterium]
MQRALVERFAGWIDSARVGILLLSVAIVVACGALAVRLSIHSDLTNLLPASQKSVKDLNAVRDRARPFGTMHVTLESPDAALNARAAEKLIQELSSLPPDLVAQLAIDDGPRNRYAWAHRFLFADLKDLTAARDALRARIDKAKVNANPLFINIDDDESSQDKKPVATDQLDALEKKLDELEQSATSPPPRASSDGTMRSMTLQTYFSASETGKAEKLWKLVEKAIANTRASVGPGVDYGLSGNITLGLYEHDSVLDGMTLSLAITLILVGIALVVYYRSGKIVLAMLWSLGVGVMITFALAWALIGHLNVMTAFLFAIVIGNGINAGLIFVARFLEELRAEDDADTHGAIVTAMREAIPGTLAATATAGVAYASLLVTDFRGFKQFGAIGGIGMAATWLTTFTVLPALLFVLGRHGLIKRTRPPRIGEWLARLHPTNDRRALLVFAGITAAAIAIASLYIAHDPFTRDWRDLQSSTAAIHGVDALAARMREKLPQQEIPTGQAYQLVFAVDKREDVAPLVAYLRQADKNLPPEKRWIRDVFSLDDVLPTQQTEKLAVLAEIRTLLDDQALQAELSPEDAARLAKLRPPDDLRRVTDADVPPELAWLFTEKDGSIGRLVVLRGAGWLNSFNVEHRQLFAAYTRAMKLPVPAIVASESLIVSDIIVSMEHDAPKMVLFAVLGSIVAVFFVIGLGRHGLVTIVCGLAGVVCMIAACAIVRLPVHFLDLIALPITVGIGIDYAVNIAARDRAEGDKGPEYLLRTVGGTVLLCSFTTSVGYGTLLLSANGGIRAFGLAALLGEITCIGVALIAAPALLAVLRRRTRAKNH